MNNPMYFEIQADNVQRAVDFYKTVFGWQMSKWDAVEIEYYQIETTGIAGGILPRPVPVPTRGGTNAAVISMEVANFDETASVILANGGIEALPKFAIAGRCWQGYFVDTENNTFGIFEADPEAK